MFGWQLTSYRYVLAHYLSNIQCLDAQGNISGAAPYKAQFHGRDHERTARDARWKRSHHETNRLRLGHNTIHLGQRFDRYTNLTGGRNGSTIQCQHHINPSATETKVQITQVRPSTTPLLHYQHVEEPIHILETHTHTDPHTPRAAKAPCRRSRLQRCRSHRGP